MNIDDELRKVVMDLMTDQRDSFCFDDHLAKIKALFKQGHCCDCSEFGYCALTDGSTSGNIDTSIFYCASFEPKQTDKQGGKQMNKETIEMVNIADLIESNGKTIKENNLSIKHLYDVGELVQLSNGVRAFVYQQTRDCDGTPLYTLTLDDHYNDPSGFGLGLSRGHSQSDITIPH